MQKIFEIEIDDPGTLLAIARDINTIVFRDSRNDIANVLWFPATQSVFPVVYTCMAPIDVIEDALSKHEGGHPIVEASWSYHE